MNKSDIEKTFHVWERTNPVAKYVNGRQFNKFRCRRCGITGRMYVHDYGMKIDKRYNDNIYLKCNTSIKELQKLKEMS